MSQPSILIIDDEPDNFDVIETFLSHENYQLHYSADGEDAIATLDTFQPDLILLDVMMPGLDGFAVCQHIKTYPKWQIVPIIMVTALTSRNDLARCLHAGADDFISKPVNSIELRSRVRSMLRIRQQYQENQQLCRQLKQTNQALETTLTRLKNTQAQLVHKAKLSITGQMIASLAHEINNPISFIIGNLEYSHDYAQTLLKTVSILQAHCPNDNPDLKAKLRDSDLDFIAQDFPKILNSMELGAERIQTLILNLRNFTRLDEAKLKYVDIHEGIDNTLVCLQNRLSPQDPTFTIDVVKEYGNLPKIECYASSINLVFFNILTNAIDALEQFLQQPSIDPVVPQIIIKTQATSEAVTVTITDNGPGMEADIAQKIFDPFFTTKPVGEGMGINLAICSQIVLQQHQGKLDCITAPGQGTTFIIRLPLEVSSPIRQIKNGQPALPV